MKLEPSNDDSRGGEPSALTGVPSIQLPAWLGEVKSLADIAATVHASERNEVPDTVWKRCALVREFDQTLYNTLTNGIQAPVFSQFGRFAGVQAYDSREISDDVPQTRLALSDHLRQSYLAKWARVDAELSNVCDLIATYYRGQHRADDELRFLALAKSRDALKQFLDLYQEADERFDLGRCAVLVELFREHYALLTDEFQNELNDREQYLRSRSLFAAEYYRTLAYVDRPELSAPCDRLLDRTGPPILHLYGPGGLGKTMFVQRLITHRCLPESNGRRIPVARIDLDFIDLNLLSEQPWLLLLPMAIQLRPQMRQSPFSTLIGPEEAVLARQLSRETRSRRKEDQAALSASGIMSRGKIVSMFTAGMGPENRAILIIDTLEEMMLHYPNGLVRLLQELLDVQANCSGLAIILSGRYDIVDPQRPSLPFPAELRIRLCRSMSSVKIAPFDSTQSYNYLAKIRRLQNEPVIAAIISRSSGNPFTLSLFAELAAARPLITADDVQQCPEADVAYLIERVIDRIPIERITDDDTVEQVRKKQISWAVRWLLRYAVIPQELTPDFVKNVLGRFLDSEIAGRTKRDDVSLNQLAYKDSPRWVRREGMTMDLHAVWLELCKYASQYGWISGDQHLLRLKPEVVDPMRQLLRRNTEYFPIYNELHEASAVYCEDAAAKDPRQAAKLLRQALYHRFQYQGAEARRHWLSYRGQCRQLGADACRDLAEGFFTKDYLDDNRNSLPHHASTVLVDNQTLSEAAFESAHASLLLWLRPLHDPRPVLERKMKERLADYKRFAEAAGQKSVADLALLQAGTSFFENNGTEARKLLIQYLSFPDSIEPLNRVAAMLLLAAILPSDQERADLYHSAFEICRKNRMAAFPEYFLLGLTARHFASRNVGEAINLLDRACALAIDSLSDPTEASALLQVLGDLCFANGQFSHLQAHAEKIIRNPGHFHFPAREEAAGWLVQIHLLFQRLDAAQQVLAETSQGFKPAVLEREADVAAFLCDFDRASQLYNNAEQLYDQHNFKAGAIQIILKRARMCLEGIGHLKQAESMLYGLRSFGDPAIEAERYQLMVQLETAKGDADQASVAYNRAEVFFKSNPNLSQVHNARALATLVAGGFGGIEAEQAFLSQLARLELPSSRFVALLPLRKSSRKSNEKAGDYLKVIQRPPAKGPDWFVHNLGYAAGCRFFNKPKQLKESLKSGIAEVSNNPFAISELAYLISNDMPELEVPRALPNQWQAIAKLTPARSAVGLLEEAERELIRTNFSASRSLLREYFALSTTAFRPLNQWTWRSKILESALLQHDGRHEEAVASLREAAATASDLGDSQAAALAQRLLDEPHARFSTSPLSPARPSSESQVVVAISGDFIEVTTAQPKQKRLVQSVIGQILARTNGDFCPTALITLASDGALVKKDVSAVLEPVYRLDLQRISLLMELSALSCIPWELGRPPNSKSQIYRSHLNVPVPPLVLGHRNDPTVVILQGDAGVERHAMRGYGVRGIRVSDYYQQAGFKVHVLTLQNEEWRWELQSIRPSILHISCALNDSQNPRDVFLDTLRFESQSFSHLIRPSTLARILEECGPAQVRPFLVLDAYFDPDNPVRQGLLRNYFAASVFKEVASRGVLAIGTWQEPQSLQGLMHLTKALASHSKLIDLQETLSCLSDLGPLAFPPSLFTCYPDLEAF